MENRGGFSARTRVRPGGKAAPARRASALDQLTALRTDRDVADPRTDQLFDAVHVGLRGLRQLGELAAARDVFAPAGHRLVDGGGALEARGREVLGRGSVEAVAIADLELGAARQTIELGERDLG